ncbi:unnamed protein product [Paramecium sonneborni]|uniref:Uncharacterized protein n=1 Tax=Paramecium sonneborni TaxID=65129 RepID=A0A8S1KW55_9CILI|nr:unnamed protein product [Paramecium sonneborni]
MRLNLIFLKERSSQVRKYYTQLSLHYSQFVFAQQKPVFAICKSWILNSYFYIVIILTIMDILITMSIIIYYGRKLKKVLVYVKQRFSSNKNESHQYSIQSPFFEADLPNEKIHQIQVVVYSITINTILYIIIILILFWSDQNLLCNFEEDDKLDVKNNIMIFIFTATQLFPCFMVPYAFNYRVKENPINDDGLEFTRERAASSKFQMDESNDIFVQRLTRGRTKQDDE